MSQDYPGFQDALDAIQALNPDEQEKLFVQMATRDPKLVELLKAEMIQPKDLLRLSQKDLFSLVTKAPKSEMLLGLKVVDKSIREELFALLGERVGGRLSEDFSDQPPVPASKAKGALKTFMEYFRNEVDSGSISLSSNNEVIVD